MIDEKELADRLADAASAQDNLLPRALSDDLAAGRHRLRRHRLLTGTGVIGGAAAVAVLVVGMTSWLTPNASPLPADPPVAGLSQAVDVKAQDAAFNATMRNLLAKHFDPNRQHLTYESGPFEVNHQPGQREATGRAGWKIAGQRGEGELSVSVYGSGTGKDCGQYEGLKCHSVPMSIGGSAQIGRLGERVELKYQQPDGEIVYLSARPLFANNSASGVHGMGLTDAELMSFAADPQLNLPPMTAEEAAEEEALKAPVPDLREVVGELEAVLPGGTVDVHHIDEVNGNYVVALDWKKGPLAATIEFGVDAKLRASTCVDQLSVPECTTENLPDGKTVQYHEGARSYQEVPKYVMGATYTQPDGDLVSVRFLYPGKTLPAGAATKEQVLELVTDPVFDK
ncbi:hypothetical protein [Kribbella ginsengisoli]|uniref:DUF4179 domain-containing protein n=1 Tax=Kribbella ginsengisoli TaxID=363865 RepID=A0ABP6Z0U3_9ACTN